MRKSFIVLLAAVLVVAFAAPAMADLKVTGFYRSKAMLSNFFNAGTAVIQDKHDRDAAYVEQRARIKFDAGTENARAVFHFESDMNWGIGSGNNGGRNMGGALSADAVQLETKEVYVWFKIPDTSISAKVGMQTVDDHYAGIFSNGADMAGIFVNGEFEPVKWTLGWAKLYENSYFAADDASLYLASAQFAPSKDMTLGVNFYWLKDDTGRSNAAVTATAGSKLGLSGYTVDVYMPGVNFVMNAGAAKISAFAFYQLGRATSTLAGQNSKDIEGYMLDLRADIKAGAGNFFVEGFYIGGDHKHSLGDATNKYRSIITLGDYQSGAAGTSGNSGFGRTNMYFLFGADSLNVSQCVIGCSGSLTGDNDGFGNYGYGLWHVATGYSQKFTEKVRGSVNLGYAAAVDAPGADGMGFEANARVDYTVSRGLDLSLVGSYLYSGEFFVRGRGPGHVTTPLIPLNPERNYYMVYGRVGFSF